MIGGAVLVAGAVAVTAGVLSAGPAEHVRHAYAGQRTFVSAEAGVCVDATVRGTAVGTRAGTGPLTHWTDVRLIDPTMTAAGYAVSAGRCDRTRPVRLAATLEQRWPAAGHDDGVRRSDEGPAVGVLSQFNSGAPVQLPGRGVVASAFDRDYAVTGRFSVDARFAGGSEGFTFPVRLELAPATR
ncbi:hypothetical protein CLV52_1369 [Amnibacterium kyonggiense]|uniref:Uncharacterized protein n=1 Tax=Amnibacterium kyonggiense TaxID=595671 RepID=A0A4R7FSJ1_9MICO|nr:hypothetical protein CLV52_1369 [Amnibacterium kyonggiense]